MLSTLSGRFLLLAALFVALAVVLISVPSIARFRLDYLEDRMERAQIASLALLGADAMIPEEVERELLLNAGVLNVALRRDASRTLVLSSALPGPVTKVVDLRSEPTTWTLVRDALSRLLTPGPEVVRVIAAPTRGGGETIEAAIETSDLRRAMVDHGLNILWLSLAISVVTSILLFLAVRSLMVAPVRALVAQMRRYAAAPEDARRVIEPRSTVRELRDAEVTLRDLETQLTALLRQKERLAQLGAAVAKVSHDLRNILTTATLLADRMERVDDPTVRRVAPKIVASLTRAVNLTEGTLAFGRAEEAPPALQWIEVAPFLDEICEGEQLAVDPEQVAIVHEAPAALTLRADPEQLHRILGNLIRNARQAIAATGRPGTIRVSADATPDAWILRVRDDGPGLPGRARENLFQAFQGNVRKGGIGLGLAIAQELARGHGGDVSLEETGAGGTTFAVVLPREIAQG